MPSPSTLSHRGVDFLGADPVSITIAEDFLGDERLMVDTAEQFSRKEVLPLADRLEHQEDGLMPALIQQAGELGFCGADAPEAYGGLDLPKNLAARMLEFLSLNPSFSVTLGVTSGISQVGLVMFGDEAQKRTFLPPLVSGEWIGAYALSEPDSGTDALAATTRAERKGGDWVLNGTKMWISNAKWAQLFLVMAKVDGEHFSAFLVPRDTPGLSVAREEHKLGLKGSSTARVLLDDATIPTANLLHEVGKGHQVAFNALNYGRFKLAAMSIGPAREAIGLASVYAMERRQFGRPIGNFGLVRRKFAHSLARFYAAESAIYRTGALLDEAWHAYPATVDGRRAAAEEFSVECSICKVLATEAEGWIADEMLQVYGGYGFTEEFRIARLFRDVRVSRIYEGTNEINRVFIADRALKRLREGRIAEVGLSGPIGEWIGAAWPLVQDNQYHHGAFADLVLYAYAEQSARIRAGRTGGLSQTLSNLVTNLLLPAAAEAYQAITGRPVDLPAPLPVDEDAIAQWALDRNRPYLGTA